MLRTVNLTKVYKNGTVALENVSFEVPDGAFMAIIGLSGSGKSTLLRCINRLVEPTSGEVWLDEINITAAKRQELRTVRRRIGMIFQQFNLVDRSSVRMNVLAGRLGYTPPAFSLLNYFGNEDIARAQHELAHLVVADKIDNRA